MPFRTAGQLEVARHAGIITPATARCFARTANRLVGVFSACVLASCNPVSDEVVGPQGLTLSETSVEFTATAGGPAPSPRTVSVQGSHPGLRATVSYTAGPSTDWLNATLNGSVLTLSARSTSLPSGTYAATVTVSSTLPPLVSASLSVTLTVTGGSAISLSPATITFSAPAGGPNPTARMVSVTSSQPGTLTGLAAAVTYTSGQPGGWLSATLSSTNSPATLTLTASTGSLAMGTYSATVSVSSSTAGVVNSTIAVTFTVTAPAPPAISLSGTEATFTGFVGGTASSALTIHVTNGGSGTLDGLTTAVAYQAGQVGGWLTATLSGATAPATIVLNPTVGTLVAGTYNATVSVSSTVAGVTNSPRTIAVSLTVSLPPRIVLSAAQVGVAGTAGGANPATSLAVSVTNGAPGALSGLATSVSYGSGQATGWLTATLNSTTTPATLTVGVAAGTLLAGTYDATIHVTTPAPGVVNSPAALPVRFRVAVPAPGALTNGSLLSGSIAAAGQVDFYRIDGQANRRITLSLAEVSSFGASASLAPRARATLTSPSGVTVTSIRTGGISGESGALTTVTLPETGSYIVSVNSANLTGIGTYNLGILEEAPAAPIASLQCGTLLTGRMGVPGLIDQYSVAGQAGKQIALSLAEVTSFGASASLGPRARASLRAPSGSAVSTITTGGISGEAGAAATVTLPETGTYVVHVHSANLRGIGTYSFGLSCLN